MKITRKIAVRGVIVAVLCMLLLWFTNGSFEQLVSDQEDGATSSTHASNTSATAELNDRMALQNESSPVELASTATASQTMEDRLRSVELLWWPQPPATTESLIADLLTEWDGLLGIDSITCNETSCETYYRALSDDSMPDFLQSERAKNIGIRGYTPAAREDEAGISEGRLVFTSYSYSSLQWTEELFLRSSFGTFTGRLPADTRPNHLGTFNGVDAVQLVDCFYGCPDRRTATIALMVPEDLACDEVGGTETVLQTLTSFGTTQIDACVPRVIAERQASQP